MRRHAVNDLRPQPVHREIRAETARQIPAIKNFTHVAVHGEEARPAPVGLNHHQRGTERPAIGPAEYPCQFLNRRRLQKRRQRQFLLKHLLHPGKQPRRHQRISAQLEEVLVHADRPRVERFLPQRHQSRLDIVVRGDVFFRPSSRHRARWWRRQRLRLSGNAHRGVVHGGREDGPVIIDNPLHRLR